MSVAEPLTTASGEANALDDAAIEGFAGTFRGHLIRPGDAEYDTARHVWNGMIDKRPALIARCTGTADVAAAVKFARAHDLLVAVRGGGHNVAGNAVNDGGLVIDLSPMKGVLVDPLKRTARAQPGASWGDLDRETQLFGLATPGGEVSTTGIAGYTLSGGLGLLHRKWGLACDNLLSVEVVTAGGDVLQASMTEHPDLFWAVRGGGGNFGIVTWFEYQLHPLGPEIFTAGVVYPLTNAPLLLRAWREFARHAADEITSEALFWSVPPRPDLPPELHGVPIVIFAGLYAGPADEGERALQPLRELGTPLFDLSGRAGYAESQSSFDHYFPTGLRYYWKSLFLDLLDDDLIEILTALAADRPSPQTLFGLRHLGGAIAQVPDDATAYGNRRAAFNLSLDAIWDDAADDARVIGWVRQAWADLRGRCLPQLCRSGRGERAAGAGRSWRQLRAAARDQAPL